MEVVLLIVVAPGVYRFLIDLKAVESEVAPYIILRGRFPPPAAIYFWFPKE